MRICVGGKTLIVARLFKKNGALGWNPKEPFSKDKG